MLLDRGADVNMKDSKGYTALMWASYFGSPEMVNILLDRGADVNVTDKFGDTALIIASKWGSGYYWSEEIVNIL